MVLRTIDQMAASGQAAESLLEYCLERRQDSPALAQKVFTKQYSNSARAQALAYDNLKAAGAPVPKFAGIPVSIKDLFDVQGDTTTCGSKLLIGSPPATSDASAVRRLRQAGFIPVGRTNMTEFAYSGLGLNPHYGTPENPWDRGVGRIPGGSTSGGAIAVTDQMAIASLGTDTGGSCRIPAALCGIVGFKPTASHIPQDGMSPLSPSLDAVGFMGASVECMSTLYSVLSGSSVKKLPILSIEGLRLAVPQNLVLDDLDSTVATTFERALRVLSLAGARIEHIAVAEFDDLPSINAKGGFAAAEAWAWHRELIEKHHNDYDPNVVTRIKKGELQSAADYLELMAARAKMQKSVSSIWLKYDALVMPTVATVAPTIRELEHPDKFQRSNALMLRNPSTANFLDQCAITLPCHTPGEAPVGLSLLCASGDDKRLLAFARSVELALRSITSH